MGAGEDDEIGRAAVEGLASASGVRLNDQEIDAVVRSLARIHRSAAPLLQSMPFDQSGQEFYCLLESDADEAGR